MAHAHAHLTVRICTSVWRVVSCANVAALAYVTPPRVGHRDGCCCWPAVRLARRCAASQRAVQIRHSSVRRLCTLTLRSSVVNASGSIMRGKPGVRETAAASRCTHAAWQHAPSGLPFVRKALFAERGRAKVRHPYLIHDGDARLYGGSAVARRAHVPREIEAESVHQVVLQQRPHAAPSLRARAGGR